MNIRIARKCRYCERQLGIGYWSLKRRENGVFSRNDNDQSPIRQLFHQSAIYCAAPTGAMAMSIIGVFMLSVLTSVALPDGKYIE
jgi:hypothetical protein